MIALCPLCALWLIVFIHVKTTVTESGGGFIARRGGGRADKREHRRCGG